ncbi:hypothetical protein ACWEO2_33185 [Nocardia sp. NPDC004278]
MKTCTAAASTVLTDLARQGGAATRFAASGVHENGYTTQLLDAIDHRT